MTTHTTAKPDGAQPEDAPVPVTHGSACGKTILLGEHAVVYGRPAIAAPVPSRRASVSVRTGAPGSGIAITAHDLGARYLMGHSCVDDHGRFLLAAVEGALRALFPGQAGPDFKIVPDLEIGYDLEIGVRSSIPIARGMGSGAAVSAAIARGIAAHLGATLSRQDLSELVYATERLLHGTPSGIDNTVVAWETPVWFRKGQGAEPFAVGAPLALVIGDTGIASRTRESVALVRRRWEAQPGPLEALFDAIGGVVEEGRAAIAQGALHELGRLMDRNQALLQELGVSDPALEGLIGAARQAGALGSKLSGGGLGGCMIALAAPGDEERVEMALRAAGARDAITARIDESASQVD
jgi:mevalonate kinase